MLELTIQSSYLKDLKNLKKESQTKIQEPYFLRQVRGLILTNFNNEQFDVADLARKVHLSVSQLNRKLNVLINKPAGQLIWTMRMDYASNLLLQDEYSIGQIGYLIGYRNQAHFCRSFKRRYKCTPSQFRKIFLRNRYAQNR